MITEERVLDFIRSFGVDRGSEALHMIEKEAIRDDVRLSAKSQGNFFEYCCKLKNRRKFWR